MRRMYESAPCTTDLRLCPACAKPFVAPCDVLASDEDGHVVVELGCANCGWTAVQLHDGLELVALDRALDRDSAQIEAAADALAVTLELERIDRFALALQNGHILPEDF